MNSKTVLLLAAVFIVSLFLFKDCTSCKKEETLTVGPVIANIDSLTAIIKGLQWYAAELEKKAEADKAAAATRLASIQPLQSRVKELAKQNGILKDTLARLKNCDTLAADCSELDYQIDSLRTELHTAWQSNSDMVDAYDMALQASNERALQETKARQILTMKLASQKEPSRISIGFHVGYGLGIMGPTPVASIGINYSLIKFKKK